MVSDPQCQTLLLCGDGLLGCAVSYVALAPVDLCGPAVSYVAPALVDGFSGPVTFSAPVESDASTPVLSGESCHDDLRGATEVPTERFTSGYMLNGLFELVQHDAQLTARLLSNWKACEVVRGLWRCVSRGCLPSCSSLKIKRWLCWSWKGRPRSLSAVQNSKSSVLQIW